MTTLTLFNSLTRTKSVFTPINPPKVGMYVCGITVYDYCHLGHARSMVVFDIVVRWLRACGYQVNFVRNITDIDDKIIRRAIENGESINALTERFIKAMHEDEEALGVLRPDHEPRATQHINGMIKLIKTLQEKGYAYQIPSGDMCYAVRKFEGYGKLSGKTLDQLRAGERVETNQEKNDPLDFVLWKAAKPGEPQWESPFGSGRPGWHIECSAMSAQLLGTHFDIHGGGHDLQFPHHENEIAQSEAAHDHAFANVWMHNGYLNIDDTKMSKSLNNFFTIREVLEKWPAEVIRFFLVRSHYRSPVNFSEEALEESRAALSRLYQALRVNDAKSINSTPINWQHPVAAKFKAAMDDDFNTPVALSVLFELVQEINKQKNAEHAIIARGLLLNLGGVLGLLQQDPEVFFRQGTMEQTLSDQKIEELIHEREVYRRNKNFSEADRIRDELLESGVILDDSQEGTTWKRL